MSVKVLTLFGEELLPEPEKPAEKPKAYLRKKREKKLEPEPIDEEAEEPVAVAEEAPAAPKPTSEDMLAGWKGDKQYYAIGEVAKLFDVKTSNIRFWTNEFALKVRTTRKGDRLYTPANVRQIQVIYHLVKERGFTIAGAKAKMKANKKAPAENIDLKKSLKELRNTLEEIKNRLT